MKIEQTVYKWSDTNPDKITLDKLLVMLLKRGEMIHSVTITAQSHSFGLSSSTKEAIVVTNKQVMYDTKEENNLSVEK